MQVSLIQMNSVMDVAVNFNQAQLFIYKAAKSGSRIILLPEMFLCLGVKNQSKMASTYFSKNSDLLNRFKSLSQELGVYIIAGSLPLPVNKSSSDTKDKVYAGCLVFSPDGQIIDQYNKMHLFDVDVADEKGRYRESDTFMAGDKPVITDIDGIKCGLSICYDLRFSSLFEYYQGQQCQIICVPSAFTYETGKAHWLNLLQARAIETQCFVLAANQDGLHQDGRRTYGHSVVIDPWGQVLAKLDQGVGVITANLDFNYQDSVKCTMPVAQHKHDFFKPH